MDKLRLLLLPPYYCCPPEHCTRWLACIGSRPGDAVGLEVGLYALPPHRAQVRTRHHTITISGWLAACLLAHRQWGSTERHCLLPVPVVWRVQGSEASVEQASAGDPPAASVPATHAQGGGGLME